MQNPVVRELVEPRLNVSGETGVESLAEGSGEGQIMIPTMGEGEGLMGVGVREIDVLGLGHVRSAIK